MLTTRRRSKLWTRTDTESHLDTEPAFDVACATKRINTSLRLINRVASQFTGFYTICVLCEKRRFAIYGILHNLCFAENRPWFAIYGILHKNAQNREGRVIEIFFLTWDATPLNVVYIVYFFKSCLAKLANFFTLPSLFWVFLCKIPYFTNQGRF